MTTSKRKHETDKPADLGDGVELFQDAPVDELESDNDIDKEGHESDANSSEYSNIGEDEESTDNEEDEISEEDEIETKEPLKLTESNEFYKVTEEYGLDDPDTSDEEDIRNTVGNIPMEWYEGMPHIGYNLDGKKILKPIRNADELDKFLEKMDNPNFWKTIFDPSTARNHVLTDEQLAFINRIKSGKYHDSSYDPYEPSIDFFTHEKMIHPINNAPAHKRSFIPSIEEKKKVSRMVRAIKMGLLHPPKPKPEKPEFYDIWDEQGNKHLTHSELARLKMHIPAPKTTLPTHAESYRPPPEYLFNEEERLEWEGTDPEDRKLNFIPRSFDCLRRVPQYPQLVQDRFARCLDLYLCPRQRKMRMNVDPEDLIPKLAKPKDLQPFPTTQALCYKGHTDLVRTISPHSTGQWLASGSDDGTVRIWEVCSGRCITTINTSGPVKCVQWCPNKSVCLLAAVVNDTIVIINPYIGDRLVSMATDQLIESYEKDEIKEEVLDEEEKSETKEKQGIVSWSVVDLGPEFKQGWRLILKHPKAVSKVTWHNKGDYFASVMPSNTNTQVLLHQMTKRRSQNPFNKCKGLVQTALFHPNRPFLFVATQRYIRVYNLVKQELTKKLLANAKWISCLAIHPGGDNVIAGSYDCRLSWFDMDLSVKAYRTLRFHKKAIRSCSFHNKYPLFASCSDDGSVVVCHGMVYSDLLKNPLIVPVKVLKGHRVERNLGVLDCCFHPQQPWIFSSAADNTIRLFS